MRFKAIATFFSGFSGFFLFVMAMSNFYLAYRASSNARRVVTVTNVVECVSSTNNLSSLPPSAPDAISTNIPSHSPPAPVGPSEVAQTPYEYFIVGRRIGVRMFGRYYYEGSPCSYGRISEIYPDRIFLRGGDWISNRFSSDVVKEIRHVK